MTAGPHSRFAPYDELERERRIAREAWRRPIKSTSSFRDPWSNPEGDSMSGSHSNTFPKIHNAMWPGLVGKGSPDGEPTIDLDTMLNLTAAAQVDGIKFDGVDIFLYDPHINIDISDEGLKAVAAKIADKGFVVGLGGGARLVRRLGHGGRPPARELSDRHSQSLPDRQEAARAGGSALWRRAYRLGRLARRLGQGPARTRRRSPRHSSGPPPSLAITANAWPRKGKSAGAACTRGGRWSTCSKRSASPRRSAFRRIWPTRCCTRLVKTHPRTGSCPRTTTGKIPPFLTRP